MPKKLLISNISVAHTCLGTPFLLYTYIYNTLQLLGFLEFQMRKWLRSVSAAVQWKIKHKLSKQCKNPAWMCTLSKLSFSPSVISFPLEVLGVCHLPSCLKLQHQDRQLVRNRIIRGLIISQNGGKLCPITNFSLACGCSVTPVYFYYN